MLRAISIALILVTSLQCRIAVGQAENWDVSVADWDADGKPDLIGIKKWDTSTKKTEIHVTSGASNYQQVVFRGPTVLGESDDRWIFTTGDWDRDGKIDLFGVLKSRTGSKHTEVHILSGASGFQQFIFQGATFFDETGKPWDFTFADWDRDGTCDLVGILKYGTGSKKTEVHILSGASGFQSFICQTPTCLDEIRDNRWHFSTAMFPGESRPNLVGMLMLPTVSGEPELHVLSGTAHYNAFALQAAVGKDEGRVVSKIGCSAERWDAIKSCVTAGLATIGCVHAVASKSVVEGIILCPTVVLEGISCIDDAGKFVDCREQARQNAAGRGSQRHSGGGAPESFSNSREGESGGGDRPSAPPDRPAPPPSTRPDRPSRPDRPEPPSSGGRQDIT